MSRWLAVRAVVIGCALAVIEPRLIGIAVSAYWAATPLAFYASTIGCAALVLLAVLTTPLRKVPGFLFAGLLIVFLAVLLPVVDAILRRQTVETAAAPKPTFSFRAARGHPEAFRAWWTYYAREWTRPDGGKARTEGPDPRGILPFVHIPNSRGTFFESEIRINNLGFRGKDVPFEKGDHFRIFTLGDSPVQGATMRKDDRPWPDVLQDLINRRLDCDRPVQVINAGVENYNLKNSIELLRRSVLPLKPDVVVYYTSLFNNLVLFGSRPTESIVPPPPVVRASPLLAAAEYRLMLRRFMEQQRERAEAAVAQRLHETEYHRLLLELLNIGRDHRFTVVLTTTSMAVTTNSPREVIDFYGRTFRNIDWALNTVDIQNRMMATLAKEHSLPFIDTRANLAGRWDDDLFIDLVHFTQKGRDLLADRMFEGLEPVLHSDGTLHCRAKSR